MSLGQSPSRTSTSQAILACFSTRIDGTIFDIRGDKGFIRCEVESGMLVFRICSPFRDACCEVEDSVGIADGRPHAVAMWVGDFGTHFFLDGIQCFSSTSTVSLADIGAPVDSATGGDAVRLGDDGGPDVWDFTIDPAPSKRRILAAAPKPSPIVEFASNELSPIDVTRIARLHEGCIALAFRVRGVGQEGTVLSAGNDAGELLDISVCQDELRYRVRHAQPVTDRLANDPDSRATPAPSPTSALSTPPSAAPAPTLSTLLSAASTPAPAASLIEEAVITRGWNSGDVFHIAVNVGRGSVELYVNGYCALHQPGGGFFASTLADKSSITRIVIGQDLAGRRLCGDVHAAAIYDTPLNDWQLKRLAGVDGPGETALFDRGLLDAACYRIPSLLALPDGTLLAGADQRVDSPNDSPNRINFCLRRSTDGGHTWDEVSQLTSFPGHGAQAASVIDSCLVHDVEIGRTFVILDHFPAGIGLFNASPGIGVDPHHQLPLAPDGSSGSPTLPTSYLMMMFSDDSGKTWSPLIHLNHQVKQEWMTFLGTGPGNGIQLRHGPHAGRLLIPVYFSHLDRTKLSSAVIYSDDHGQSWTRSGSPNDHRTVAGSGSMPDVVIDPRTLDDDRWTLHESTVVEDSQGRVLMLTRNQDPRGKVLKSVSSDGGQTWSAPEPIDEITEIFSQPNAVAWPRRCESVALTADAPAHHQDTRHCGAEDVDANVSDTDTNAVQSDLDPRGDGGAEVGSAETQAGEVLRRIAFANASQLMPFRGHGVVRLSYDDGDTWPVAKTLCLGHYVYQCMTPLGPDALGVLWERETQGLYFTRLDASWFTW